MSVLDFQMLMWLLLQLAADGQAYTTHDARETFIGRHVARS
jgi:hypothetical protein